ncbi:hypothetical protein F3J44_25990 [Pantoea sp. Tr-811]|uniref:alginate O-acetyltransferase AlgX-related protein n=1 Tax=Pantoea sp. Tr-811 TaxID=2608361 RepID=UPI001423FA1C|nr:hypothetical protein [Pantoea sp. Tr-811]NIF29804.1 hypothetical protein [Pantoea sp. Tr-811]
MTKLTARIHSKKFDKSAFKFSIDFPRTETFEVADASFLPFRAWAFATDSAPLQFVFDFNPDQHVAPNTTRTDVKSFYPEAPTLCGINIILPMRHSFQFGVIHNNAVTWLASVELTPLSVLEGHNGYLFLDNDDNESIAQYTGRHCIDKTNIDAWRDYFIEIRRKLDTNRIKFGFCIAPAKEYVYPDAYPNRRLGLTPYDQFTSEFQSHSTIIDPLEKLSSERHLTYSKNDTHWTDFGAQVVAELICDRLNITYLRANFPYLLTQTTGDLGIKFNPQKTEHLYVVDRTKLACQPFNNLIPVRGNIIVLTNPCAAKDETCLIFGSSSSESVAIQLTATFSRVVRVFSGADIDWNIVDQESPSCILVVFASRFLIRAPRPDFRIESEIIRKLRTCSPAELSSILSLTESHWRDSKNQYYLSQLSYLLDHTE